MALTSYTGTSGNLINLNVPQDYTNPYFTVNTTIPAGVYQMTIPSTVNSVFIGSKTFTASGLVNIPTTQTVVYGDVKYVPTVWTTRNSSIGDTTKVAFGNGTFIIVRGSTQVAGSTDGLTWTTRLTPNSAVRAISWGNGLWVAPQTGGSDNLGRVYVSTDGITWSTRVTASLGSGLTYTEPAEEGTVYGNGIHVSGGITGSGLNYIIRSYDNGTTFTGGTITIANMGGGNLKAIGYGNNSFIAVGGSGNMAASGNSVSWTTRVSGTTTALYTVAYGNGLWVAAGGAGVLQTSPDGTTWTARTSNMASEQINKVSYINGTWYGLGGSGTLTQSTDGITWTLAARPPSNSAWYGIAYGKGRYVLANSDSNLWVSSYTVPADATVQLEYKGVGSVAV